ncbi:hypothetical protein BGZ49_007040 [Haplosporangium sp. Z 27]|nr:hypothetical protein BGZ49_007040 [Haplosporangium sp. Z 27]
MGILIDRDFEGEMMVKIKVLFGKAIETLNKDHPNPSFGFEQVVEGLDETDQFINDIFSFLVKEAAQRYRATHPCEAVTPRPTTIHHYLPPQTTSSSTSSSPSSSPSNSLSASLSSLAFSSRLLRHQQLVRSLLGEDEDTDLGSAVSSTEPQHQRDSQGVPGSESSGRTLTAARATLLSTNPPPRHGIVLPSTWGRVDEEDSDSDDDDFLLPRIRQESRDSDAAFAARVAIQSEMRSRHATAEAFSEPSMYRPFRSSFSYSFASPRPSIEWGSGGRRHGISAPIALQAESPLRQNEDVLLDTLNRQRRIHFLRHLQSQLPRRRGIQQLLQPQQPQEPQQPQQRQQLQQLQQQHQLQLMQQQIQQVWHERQRRGTSMQSRDSPYPEPVSSTGSLIPNNDNDLGTTQSTTSRTQQPTSPLSQVSNTVESDLTQRITTTDDNDIGHDLVQSSEPQPIFSHHSSPIMDQTQPTEHSQTQTSTPTYHEFVDVTHRARAEMRAANLAMGELQSMRRRTLNVVDTFVNILDDAEQTTVVTSSEEGLHESPLIVAQPLAAITQGVEEILPPTLHPDAHSTDTELNSHATMTANHSDIQTQQDLAAPTSSSSILLTGHSQLNCS